MLSVLIAGKAGEGIKKAVAVIADYFNQAGYSIFQYDDYQSVIKGGHNYSIVSVDKHPVFSHYMLADYAFFSDFASYEIHQNHISEDSVSVINDKNYLDFSSLLKANNFNDSYIGIVAISVIFYLLDLTTEESIDLIRKSFRKNEEKNIQCYELSLKLLEERKLPRLKIEKYPFKKRKINNGNTLIALGALMAGLDYYVSYPMTPASSILHFLAGQSEKFGVVVQHAESEIAAANMAAGATFTGARAATGSSGGGFALMTEAFSLAGMVEAPLYVIVSARPGPATGMSTYTAQADLNFVLNAGHGEFPRIVASPGTFEQAFHLSAQLLDLAWYFQTPTVLLTEKHLSECSGNQIIDSDQYIALEMPVVYEKEYKRYQLTDNGISPLKCPPSHEMIKWNSNEHYENGIRTDEAVSAKQMIEKRYRKQQTINEYVPKHYEMLKCYGEEGPVIVCYGSTLMSMLEASKYITYKIRIVQVIYLEPFPVDLLETYIQDDFIVVEQSLYEQFTQLIKYKTGRSAKRVIKAYDGRPFDPVILARETEEAINEFFTH